MLETLFSALISGIMDVLYPVITTFMEMLNLDLNQFNSLFPAAGVLYYVVRSIALGLVVAIAIWNLLKFFVSPLTKVGENPFVLLFRVFIAVFMVFFGNYLLQLVVELFKGPYSAILNAGAETGTAGWRNAWEIIKNGISEPFGDQAKQTFAIGEVGSLLLSLFILIALGINLLKLLLELVERYIMVGVLVYTSPLGWCTLASQNTTQIFSRWINMFISQCLMMLLSAWSVQLTVSILAESSEPSFLIKGIFALGFTRLAQRFDSYIQQLGLNPATTGGSIIDEVIAAGQTFGKMVGGGKKSGGGGSGESTPLGSNTGFREGNALGTALAFGGVAGLAKVGGNFFRGAKNEYAASRESGLTRRNSLKNAVKQAATNTASSFGSAPNAAIGAVKGAIKGYSSARQEGQSVGSSVLNAAKTSAKTASSEVATQKGRGNPLEAKVREATAMARNGDTEKFDKMPVTMQRYAQQLAEQDGETIPTSTIQPDLGFAPTGQSSGAAEQTVSNEEVPNAAPSVSAPEVVPSDVQAAAVIADEDIGAEEPAVVNTAPIVAQEEKTGESKPTGETAVKPTAGTPVQLNAAATRKGLSIAYKKDSNGQKNTDPANGYIIGKTEADAAKFVKENLESGVKMSAGQRSIINNTVRSLNNADSALSIDTNKISDKDFANQIWASEMISAGADTQPSEKTPHGFDTVLRNLSNGITTNPAIDGAIEITPDSDWHQSLEADGGHVSQFNYTTPEYLDGTGLVVRDEYSCSLMDENEFKRLGRSKLDTDKETKDNAIRVTDKFGTTRYLSFTKNDTIVVRRPKT